MWKISEPGNSPFSLTGQPNAMGGREVGAVVARTQQLDQPQVRCLLIEVLVHVLLQRLVVVDAVLLTYFDIFLAAGLHLLRFRHQDELTASGRRIGGTAERDERNDGDGVRLVMPAFGSYTGGLNVRDEAFADLFGTLAVSVLLGKTGRRTRTKDIPYECGMLPEGSGSARMSVKIGRAHV